MRIRLALVALAVVLTGLAAACGGSQRALPLVVDTDLSIDDAIALLYVLESPRIDVRAVTVSGTGLVHCPQGARIAARLLALGGRPEVPVACGSDLPLAGTNAVPEDWRRAADELFGVTLPPARAGAPTGAVALLRREAPGVTVLELAPMTNLARALRAEPALAAKIRAVVAMAGAVSAPGNAPDHPAAETNAWLDPAALRTVLGSGVPVTLVPLDATNDVPATPFVADALKRYHYATPAATAVWDLMLAAGWTNGGNYFWDPLAAVTLVDPAVATTAGRRIAVTADGRTLVAASGAPTTVATGADRARFERDLFGTLLDGSSFVVSGRPVATVRWDGESCIWDGPATLTAERIVLGGENSSNEQMEIAVVAVEPPHTLADLRAYVSGLTGPPLHPPSWLSGQSQGTVPPHSEMSWVAYPATTTSGSVVVACALTSPPYAAIAASVPVYGAG